ncbi:hypothetical protein [Halobacterium litoreum]|uniref:Small CPxCG-related zinc finger protein n=1 Tax=Halobacterium litoreum TaxID=2039234 RepID=A0ABD5NIP6_9EURY|nr:hypothetical protein [Halobacterium litoreum]
MSDSEPVMCPVCGWTGDTEEVAGAETATACPTCGEPLGDVA